MPTPSVVLSTDKVLGDVVTTGFTTATFSDEDVANGKTVTVTGITIGGADAANYNLLNTTATDLADIDPATVVGSFTADDKTYDGDDSATISGRFIDSGIIGLDDVTLSGGTATFSDEDVADGKTVTGTGFGLAGADAGNYVLASTTLTTTADIDPATVIGHFTAADKTYNGSDAATIDGRSLEDVIGLDDVSLSGGSATFSDKNVANGKTVTGTGFSLAGTDAGNYVLASTTLTTTADITERDLTVSAVASNKVYDGDADASVVLSTDKVLGDVVTTGSTSATFADKNVGTNKLVTVSGITIGGADAGNYNLLSTTATDLADITQRTLNVTATADDKGHDGTTTAVAHLADDRVAGDDLDLSYASADFDTAAVGNGKTVTILGISIDGGDDAANYVLGNTTTTATADITSNGATPVVTISNKVYDGGTSATILTCTLTGVAPSDDVECDTTGATASFADKNVADGKTVTVTGLALSGDDADNYDMTSTEATGLADITERDLTVSAVASNKVYDGDADASVVLSTDKILGDVVTTGFTSAAFADKNVGTNKLVTVSGITIGGADAGNYNLLSTTATDLADITQRGVTVNVTAGQSKTYGTGDPAFAYTFTPALESGDSFTGSLTRAAGNENVGAYPILQGSLTAGGNYAIAFNGANFAITQASSSTAIVSDNPDSSAAGQTITVVFSVTGFGTGSATGNVTVTDSPSGTTCFATPPSASARSS